MNSAISVTATFALADDGFPPGGAIPAGWIQPSGSNASWVVTNDPAYAGTLSLKSGSIGNSQKSDISYTANFSAGNVSFARKVSSESNFDFLEFYIDGVLNGAWSGELDWAVVSFPIAAGTHTLLWRYVKDESISSGSDAAWIDSVVLPAAPVTVPGAPTGVSATPGNASATVSFSAPSNTGGTVITSYTVTSNPGGITATGTGSPITVSGLTNGTPYTFTVRATNSVGTGIASAASNSVTPAAPVTVGLQYYSLLASNPLMLDTRPGETAACNNPGTPLTGGTPLPLLARGACQGRHHPGQRPSRCRQRRGRQLHRLRAGYITLYPSDAAPPLVANLNYNANDIVSNAFTAGFGAVMGRSISSPALQPTSSSTSRGYYAPTGSGRPLLSSAALPNAAARHPTR